MMTEEGKDRNRGEKPKSGTPGSEDIGKAGKAGPQASPHAQIVNSADGMLDEIEGAAQGMAAKTISKVVGRIAGSTSESQRAALDSIDNTVEALSKLAEGMSSEDKLKIAEQMADVGKGAERVNESNNWTWTRITQIAIGGLVLVLGGATVIATKGKSLPRI